MTRRRRTETLVVGAGPVGMLAATMLAERDVRVEIVDEEWRPAARSYALALHSRSLELLDEIGLAAELLDEGHRVTGLAFYQGTERRAEVALADRLPGAYPFLLVLPQKALEEALERRLTGHGVPVHWNHRLADLALDGEEPEARVERLGKESTGYSVAATVWVVEGETRFATDYVVGADGHRSAVRRSLDVPFETFGEPELYAVFELVTDAEPTDEVRVVIDDDVTSVLWPLGGRRVRWSFQIRERDFEARRPDKSRLSFLVGRQSYPYLSPGSLGALIAERAPWFEGSIEDVPWSVGVRFERRLAGSFGRGRVWLAGDAAHLAPPVGIHSMNLGLAEAHTLAERIAGALHDGDGRGSLDEYGRQSHEEWQRLLAIGERVEAGPEASDWVRERAARIAPCLPASGTELDRLAGALGLRIP